MRYEPLPASFYIQKRAQLSALLPVGSMLLLHSNDVFPTNADGTMPLHQNANLFYLTGIDQEETVLLMIIEPQGVKETIFVRETNPTVKVWEGARLTKEDVTKLSGVQDVQWLDEFPKALKESVSLTDKVYIEQNVHPRSESMVQTRNARMAAQLQADYPNIVLENVYGILAKMREIKTPEEISSLKQACSMTNVAFRNLLPKIKPGLGEWQVESILSYEFLYQGSRKFSFMPIIAAGEDTCVLHYIQNDKVCQDGDLLLMDIGCEYGYYNSDMTRTVPVNGKFSPRQRAVYEAVLATMEYAKTIMRPGTLKSEYERLVRVFVGKKLVELNLLTQADLDEKPNDPPAVRRYFMHGCSHFLGLDVHDVGEKDPIFAAGMVFTIEPGIYIPDEAIGIRLENDILIGETENTDLLGDVPILPDDIERLMAQ